MKADSNLVARHVVLLRRIDHGRATLDLGDDGDVLIVVPHDREVHLGLMGEPHGAVEGDIQGVLVDEQAWLYGPVADPPLLRHRYSNDGSVADWSHVPSE